MSPKQAYPAPRMLETMLPWPDNPAFPGISIGNNATIGPQAGVAKDIAAGQVVGGSPTVDYNTYLRNATLMPKLPELFKRVARIEKELGHKPMAESRTDRSLVAMWNRWLSIMQHKNKK